MGEAPKSSVPYFVDSKSICFFCLIDFSFVAPKLTETTPKIISVSRFRSVFKYLNLDGQKIFNVPSEALQKSEILVSSCKSCSIVMEEFAQLHCAFEFAQQNLLKKVQSLFDVMLTAESNWFRVSQLKQKLENGATTPLNIISTLRMETIEKFASKMNINVIKVNGKSLREEATPTPTSKATKAKTPAPVLKKSATKKPEAPTTTGTTVTKLWNDDVELCPHCKVRFTHAQNEHSRRRHKLLYHMDQFFIKLKSPSLTDYEFKRVVTDLLFSDLHCNDQLGLCPHCTGRPLQSKEELMLHFIDDHFDILKKRLQCLQNHPDLEVKLYVANPHGKACPTCNSYFQNMTVLDSHKLICKGEPETSKINDSPSPSTPGILTVKIHPGEMKPSPSGDGDIFQCRECGEEFQSRNIFVTHKMNHLTQGASTSTGKPLPSILRRGRRPDSVSTSRTEPANQQKRTVKVTIVRKKSSPYVSDSDEDGDTDSKSKKPKLPTPAEQLSNDEPQASQGKGTLPNVRKVMKCSICGQRTAEKHAHTKEEMASLTFNCSYCEEKFKVYFIHRAHVLRSHSFQMFKSYFPSEAGSAPTPQQVESCLQNVLKKLADSYKIEQQCNLCKRNYLDGIKTKIDQFESHLLVAHFDTVVARLVEFAKSMKAKEYQSIQVKEEVQEVLDED